MKVAAAGLAEPYELKSLFNVFGGSPLWTIEKRDDTSARPALEDGIQQLTPTNIKKALSNSGAVSDVSSPPVLV